MSSLTLFICSFWFLATLASAVDVRDLSIDEYIDHVNPPAAYKYQTEFGESILCVKFSDQISVKNAKDAFTQGLQEPPKFQPSAISFSNVDSGGAKNSKSGVLTEGCPENTVAIREIKREDVERAGSVKEFLSSGGRKYNDIPTPYAGQLDTHPRTLYNPQEISKLRYQADSGPFTLASARLNVWSPTVGANANYTSSEILVLSLGSTGFLAVNVIKVGWIVFPRKYGDAKPRFSTYFTNGSIESGCYNLDCPGFVKTSNSIKYTPGTILSDISVPGGQQITFTAKLSKEIVLEGAVGTVWALYVDDERIGYWPASLVDTLASGAQTVTFAGTVDYDKIPKGGPMTKTQMGSGRFPSAGQNYSAYFASVLVSDSSGTTINRPTETYSTKPKCYGASYNKTENTYYYGGPGGENADCLA